MLRALLLLAASAGAQRRPAARSNRRPGRSRQRPAAAGPRPLPVVCPSQAANATPPFANRTDEELFDGLQDTFGCKNTTLGSPYDIEQDIACQAQKLTQGCDVVMYSTLFYPRKVKLADPRPRCPWTARPLGGMSLCCVLILGRQSAASLAATYRGGFAPWRLITVGNDVESGGGRYLSRFAKILVHRAIPSVAYTVFVDYKLRLNRDPRLLVLETLIKKKRGFVGWRHPCTTSYPPQGFCKGLAETSPPFLFYEAAFLVKLGPSKVGNMSALHSQVARYRAMPELTFEHYIEGALLVRDARHALSRELCESWWAEMGRDDASDRDQVAFAFVASDVLPRASDPPCPPKWTPRDQTTDHRGVAILSERPRRCGDLCHWWYNDNLGKIVSRFG